MNVTATACTHDLRVLHVPTPTGERSPTLYVWWDTTETREDSPCAAHQPAMAVNGIPLNLYLGEAIDGALAQWRELPPDASWIEAFRDAKQSCLRTIRHGLNAVYRPGVSAGYIAVATALCANAVRTITLLSEAVLDPRMCDQPLTAREFKLSRALAGLTRYTPGALSSEMLPFGAARRIVAVKRQAAGDPRLLANIFGCDVDAVHSAQEMTKRKLRAPARALCA